MKNQIYRDRKYIDLNTIYPTDELVAQTYSISRISLTAERVRHEQMMSAFNGQYWTTSGLEPDFDYVRLVQNSSRRVMMSDTPMERNTNRSFLQSANGDVLIFGLGLGMIIFPLLQAEEVKSITVVELHQDLIDVVLPFISERDIHKKLNVVQGDCFEYHKTLPKEKKFDVVYGDIWINISTDNYEEMKQLTKNWKNRINRDNPNSFIDHWCKDYLKREMRAGY